MTDGSSPLARGLPPRLAPGLSSRRIIPARAGFTEPVRTALLSLQDHPRSRGVYPASTRRTEATPGSSPLARGLLVVVIGVPFSRGIIPARAGFTSVVTWPDGEVTDHPRSRGVYSSLPRTGRIMEGSSPLARGLRVHGPRGRRSLGIIPARAGFTVESGFILMASADHPRSRGVYPAPPAGEPMSWGSSPLARGLHGAPDQDGGRDGIIPARAGFT